MNKQILLVSGKSKMSYIFIGMTGFIQNILSFVFML